MASLPFPIRRLWLLARGAFVNRDRPDFHGLASIEDPEKFVWAILPHAARSFAPSILLLSEDDARAAAIGYLYARMLDTYEDLSPEPAQARETLAAFASRFDSDRPGLAPPAPTPSDPDPRDRAHLLLIERHHLVDQVFLRLDPPTRARITKLIQDMATGMIEFSSIFEDQQGVLDGEEQVLAYCHRVIGLPALFVMETLLGPVSTDHHRDALEVSELIQLANITRDIEKDLRRGVAYHPALRAYLGSEERERGCGGRRSSRPDRARHPTGALIPPPGRRGGPPPSQPGPGRRSADGAVHRPSLPRLRHRRRDATAARGHGER